MLIGYARVSTQERNLELQQEALIKEGCQKVFEDKVCGTRADRPRLAKALEMLRGGDTLVVWKLDRLGRSVEQLVDLVSAVEANIFCARTAIFFAWRCCGNYLTSSVASGRGIQFAKWRFIEEFPYSLETL
jgi:hypothetical protein